MFFQLSLFILADYSLIFDLFLSSASKGWKESIGFLDAELYAESFGKKLLKKSNIPEARQTLKIVGVVISSHIISFRFLPISGLLQITQVKQNYLIQSRKNIFTWRKVFFSISLRNIFRAIRKKSLYR